MGISFLSADRNEPVKFEVNRTTKKFLEYYISALESLHYVSLDFKRMDYEYEEEERIKKSRPDKPLTFKESEYIEKRAKKRAYKRIKLEDLFRPNEYSTALIDLFDEVKLPYFDQEGKLNYSSPNVLLNESYVNLYDHRNIKFGLTNRLEETMIVKGNALIKRNKSKVDYSNELIREELQRLTNRMIEYFLSRTLILYSEYSKPVNKSNVSSEYFSMFNKMKIPVLEFTSVNRGESFQDSIYKAKKQYLKFGDAIAKVAKEVSESRYDPHSSDEEEEIYWLNWLVGLNFAREILQKMKN